MSGAKNTMTPEEEAAWATQIAAGTLFPSRPAPLPHGSPNGYNRGCRCQECRAAHSAYALWFRRQRDPQKAPVHGTASSYSNWNCRCEPCTTANAKRCKDYARKRR